MNGVPRKGLYITVMVVLCVLSLLFVFYGFRFQSYRIHKIEFIIWENQHENIFGLSREQFSDYLRKCGANVDSSTDKWTVHYKGFLCYREWTFTYASPPPEAAK